MAESISWFSTLTWEVDVVTQEPWCWKGMWPKVISKAWVKRTNRSCESRAGIFSIHVSVSKLSMSEWWRPMRLHFLAVLLHPRDVSLPYFVVGIFLPFWSVSRWFCSFLPNFFPFFSLPGMFDRNKFDSWFGQSRLERPFCHPWLTSEVLSICIHSSLLGWALTTLLTWNMRYFSGT